MGLEQDIEDIRAGIKAGKFQNEASVSQGIVLRLLSSLGWPTYDTSAVWPEYSLGGRRVDFALCSPSSKPIALIEVKQIGQSEGAELQLFQYAFHDGVPMAILTDGREWNFFLPGEQGNYGERRVYKLDIVERNIKECVERLERYLKHSSVASGIAIQAARDDYRNVSRGRQMLAALPNAWSQLIEEEDDQLLEILADRVESLCGFKPDPDMVANYLKDSVLSRLNQQPIVRRTTSPSIDPRASNLIASLKAFEPPITEPHVTNISREVWGTTGKIGFSFEDKFHSARNAIETLKQVFEVLMKRDPTFADRFAGLPKHGRSRRYLAHDANDLYPGRKDLAQEHSVNIGSGWWLSTNHSKQSIVHIISMACDVAQVGFGRDLVVFLD